VKKPDSIKQEVTTARSYCRRPDLSAAFPVSACDETDTRQSPLTSHTLPVQPSGSARGDRSTCIDATPLTRPAVEMMRSFTPGTAARSRPILLMR
jgi:hypothetical protein